MTLVVLASDQREVPFEASFSLPPSLILFFPSPSPAHHPARRLAPRLVRGSSLSLVLALRVGTSRPREGVM